MDIVSVFLLKGVAVLLLLMGPHMVSCDEYAFAAVQGVVYCKPCRYKGVETLHEASAIPGAVVRLVCQNNGIQQTLEATADNNGYFFIHPLRNPTSYRSEQCKVFLVSSPNEACNQATDLHQGRTGANLSRKEVPPHADFLVFTVGPFAFEPNFGCPRKNVVS